MVNDSRMAGRANKPFEKKKRSKLGCKNCKLRGVKCDEEKPGCRRCFQYGVVCSYVSKITTDDLQFSTEREMVLGMRSPKGQNVVRVLDDQDQTFSFEIPPYISYWPTKTDALLNKFQLITAPTISVGSRTRLYQTAIVEKARSYPFMLQILMALTSIHLRSISSGMRSDPPKDEANYCYQAISMFAKEVVKPRNPEHQAMLLCASAMIYNMAFANVEAKTPEEAWPLAPPSPADLGWLKVSAAKRQLSQLVLPMGQDPLFMTLTSLPTPATNATALPTPAVALPLGFSSLFGLESRSNRTDNPYFSPAIKLSRILESEDAILVTLGFVWLVVEMADDFKELLMKKEPKALILLACWFAKISNLPVWWYRQRAIIEGQAICLYLERYHSDDMNLQVLLRYPKSIFQRLPEWDLYPASLEEYYTSSTYYRTGSVVSTPSSATPESDSSSGYC